MVIFGENIEHKTLTRMVISVHHGSKIKIHNYRILFLKLLISYTIIYITKK